VEGEIGEKCPATILRQTENAVLYCDADSGALLSAPFEVGFITDEVSQNLDEAIDFARAFGIRNIELRSVEGLSPYEYTDDLVHKIKQQCDAAGIKICAISAPLFKCDYADREEREAQIRSFEQLVKRAKILGADLLRGFGFWASGVPVDKRAEAYKPILEICKKYSVRLALEYDPSVHASTPEKLEELLSKGELFDEDNKADSGMMQLLVEAYLKSRTRLVVMLHKEDRIVKRGYYLEDDVIVMLDAYRDGGELMWLPSVKYLVGSIADMLSTLTIECEREEFAGEFAVYCNEEDYMDVLAYSVPEGKYRQLLQEEDSQAPYLWMHGKSTVNESESFIYVTFKDSVAYYFRQEEERFTYGTVDYPALVNILGHWMLTQHRELIMKMESEGEEDVL